MTMNLERMCWAVGSHEQLDGSVLHTVVVHLKTGATEYATRTYLNRYYGHDILYPQYNKVAREVMKMMDIPVMEAEKKEEQPGFNFEPFGSSQRHKITEATVWGKSKMGPQRIRKPIQRPNPVAEIEAPPVAEVGPVGYAAQALARQRANQLLREFDQVFGPVNEDAPFAPDDPPIPPVIGAAAAPSIPVIQFDDDEDQDDQPWDALDDEF